MRQCKRCVLCHGTDCQIPVNLACDGHEPGGRHSIQPHDNQRPFPWPELFRDSVVNLASSVLCVDHVEIAAVVSCNPNLAPFDAFSSVKERSKAFQRRALRSVVQTGHDRDGQFSGTDAGWIEIE